MSRNAAAARTTPHTIPPTAHSSMTDRSSLPYPWLMENVLSVGSVPCSSQWPTVMAIAISAGADWWRRNMRADHRGQGTQPQSSRDQNAEQRLHAVEGQVGDKDAYG